VVGDMHDISTADLKRFMTFTSTGIFVTTTPPRINAGKCNFSSVFYKHPEKITKQGFA
jgi:hypothetical protein